VMTMGKWERRSKSLVESTTDASHAAGKQREASRFE
jgi:hypothetical protein